MRFLKKHKINITSCFFSLCSLFTHLYAQNSTSISLEFKFIENILPNGDTNFYHIFYVTDSNNFITYKDKKYFRFCFSESKTNTDGYVRLDNASKSILFISKFIKEKNICKEANKIQTIFGFKKFEYADVCYLGALGNVRVKKVKPKKKLKDKFIFELNYGISLGSHEIRIERIEFDMFYKPRSILVYSPFLGKSINIPAIYTSVGAPNGAD